VRNVAGRNALPLHQINLEIAPMKKKKVNLRDIDTQEHLGEHNHSSPKVVFNFKNYLPAIFSFALLIAGITIDYFDALSLFKGWIRVVWYVVA